MEDIQIVVIMRHLTLPWCVLIIFYFPLGFIFRIWAKVVRCVLLQNQNLLNISIKREELLKIEYFLFISTSELASETTDRR